MSQIFDSPDKDPRQFEENTSGGRPEKPDTRNNPDPKKQDGGQQPKPQPLTREDLPDSTNESRGATGSGQRQDSN